ncbi:ctenidin-3-like isoform X3 [Athalia rosae]|uniref:ctenidin-3-like isoform X3 n=1 Tax=Athalia rosae TaxID=37344 RepID=UPI0020341E9D|nr:ctenidin-3-like isoform X3 [Athalia rosae]
MGTVNKVLTGFVIALVGVGFVLCHPGGHHHGGGGGGGGGGGHAHSYQHFHGPVVGAGQEVSWKDKHGHHHTDYVAYPSYEFAYGVADHHTKDIHNQKEHRDGKNVAGEYSVHEPGGNVRTVKYHADHHGGFHAVVHNSGGNDHSGGSYGGHGHGNGGGGGHGHGHGNGGGGGHGHGHGGGAGHGHGGGGEGGYGGHGHGGGGEGGYGGHGHGGGGDGGYGGHGHGGGY